MASSAHNRQQHFPTASDTTTAPPPTPSAAQPNFTGGSTSDSAATDLLSRLLHRLPPTLSSTPVLLRRRSSLATPTTISPQVISFPDLQSSISSTLDSISNLGFFLLTNHSIPSELARSAESDSLSLFKLTHHQKLQHFPRSWPFGFDDDDEEDAGPGKLLILDSSCSTHSAELSLSHLRDFTLEMEKIGLAVMEALLCAMGLQNPVRDDPNSVCSLMSISDSSGSQGEKIHGSVKFYPYVIGLQYQIRSQSCSLLTDSGLVSILPQMDSILVTLGDIAQVWSNGKLKKVRGMPTISMEEWENSSSVSMAVLITMPLEGTVSPLYSRGLIGNKGDREGLDNNKIDGDDDGDGESREQSMFSSFSFEDYAWRVYHERVLLKDPLDRYRI